MIKLGKWITKHRVIILIVAVVLLIPSVLGMVATRINYDMLNYLPDTMETIQGQDILLEDFGKGAFSMIVVEDMEPKDTAALKEKIAAGAQQHAHRRQQQHRRKIAHERHGQAHRQRHGEEELQRRGRTEAILILLPDIQQQADGKGDQNKPHSALLSFRFFQYTIFRQAAQGKSGRKDRRFLLFFHKILRARAAQGTLVVLGQSVALVHIAAHLADELFFLLGRMGSGRRLHVFGQRRSQTLHP